MLVSAAAIALTIASSVACTVAVKTAVSALLGYTDTFEKSDSSIRPWFAVEKATNMSPDPAVLIAPPTTVVDCY